MNLRILSNKVVSLQLSSDTTGYSENQLNIAFTNQYDEDDNTIFNVVFEIDVIHEGDFSLKCIFVTWFKSSEPIDEAFKDSDFPKINAPAIAFPFLRSFISIVTLNAGYSPAILPSINFTNFPNKKNN